MRLVLDDVLLLYNRDVNYWRMYNHAFNLHVLLNLGIINSKFGGEEYEIGEYVLEDLDVGAQEETGQYFSIVNLASFIDEHSI